MTVSSVHPVVLNEEAEPAAVVDLARERARRGAGRRPRAHAALRDGPLVALQRHAGDGRDGGESGPCAWSARTHIGTVRKNNEDCFAVAAERGLFVVCDGMGGHARGEVASATACETIREEIVSRPPPRSGQDARVLLADAIRAANRRVLGLGAGERRPGTTVAAMLWAGDRFVVAHVGDSRVSRLRRGALIQLTRDHTLVNELVDRGQLDPERAAHVPFQHVLTRCVGTSGPLTIDVQSVHARPGDVFLLASDGLNVLGADDIRSCLERSPMAATEALITRSLDEGAPDNVTVIVARVGATQHSLQRRSA